MFGDWYRHSHTQATHKLGKKWGAAFGHFMENGFDGTLQGNVP